MRVACSGGLADSSTYRSGLPELRPPTHTGGFCMARGFAVCVVGIGALVKGDAEAWSEPLGIGGCSSRCCCCCCVDSVKAALSASVAGIAAELWAAFSATSAAVAGGTVVGCAVDSTIMGA